MTEEGDEIRHAWYQWVVFVLFFQVPFLSILFAFSRFFSYSFHIFLLSNSGNSLLPSSRSLEELGGWETCLTSPGADLHKSELQIVIHMYLTQVGLE